MKRTRRIPADRKADLLNAALHLARSQGYRTVTRDAIAEHAGVTPALVSHYLGTMPQLRRAIMSAAIARSELAIIAQGLVAGDSKARAVTPEIKRRALESML